MAYYWDLFRQMFFIPTPNLTERNLPDQTGKVFIVTGGYAGVGYELSKILYAHNGTVYVAGRSADKAKKAISSIRQAVSNSGGNLELLQLDLADLSSIKKSAEEFMAREDKLHVLVNNAGYGISQKIRKIESLIEGRVMTPPDGSKDTTGHELQMGTNCLGPFLFTELLYPLLQKTAASSPPNSVRVLWGGSSAVDMMSPAGGLDMDEKGGPKHLSDNQTNYGQSKTGNLFFATEYARRYPRDRVIHLGFNPGNLKTELQRHMPAVMQWVLNTFVLYPAVYGAYTELWAGWSPDVTIDDTGKWVVPWGRFAQVKPSIVPSTRTPAEGGTGMAAKFWEWCEAETKQYA